MLRQTDKIITVLAMITGYLLLFQAVITAIEIIARKLFNFSFQGVDEIGGYVLAITATFGFGYATLMRAHTRVDFILLHLPLRIRAVIHVIAAAVMSFVSAGMFWYARKALSETIEYQSIANSPLETPIWIPQSIWLAGFALFALVSLILAVRAITLLFRGEIEILEHEQGTTTPAKEIDELEIELGSLNATSANKDQGLC